MSTQRWGKVKQLGRALREADMECYPNDRTVPYEELGMEQSAYDHMARRAMRFLAAPRKTA